MRGLLCLALIGVAEAREGYMVKLDAAWDYTTTSASGEADLQGREYPEGALNTPTQVIDTKLALGARSLGWRHLNLYGLGGFYRELSGPAELEVHPEWAHAYEDSQRVLVHLAWAEADGFASQGLLSRLRLRGGRQSHWGLAPVTFDGAKAGYDNGRALFELYVGQRAGVYAEQQESPGIVAGLMGAYDFGGLLLKVEWAHLQRELQLSERDARFVEGQRSVDLQVDAAEVGLIYDISTDTVVHAEASFVAPELSRVRGGVRWVFGSSLVQIELEQKLGRDLVYDLAGGYGYAVDDRRSTYEGLRLNLPDRQPYTAARAELSAEIADWLNLQPALGAQLSNGKDADRSPYDADQVWWGLGATALVDLGRDDALEIDGRYEGRGYSRDGGEHFADAAAGAEAGSHEASGGLRYTRGERFGGLGRRRLHRRSLEVGASGWWRFWLLENRFIEAHEDFASGFRADVRWQVLSQVAVKLSYELAKDSTVFTRSVGLFHGGRVQLEGGL